MTTQTKLDQEIAKYLPYLEEIQRKLLFVVVVLMLTGGWAAISYQSILKWILHLFHLQGITIVMTSPYQFVDLAINTGLVVGVTCALPVLLYFAITFVRPALRPAEYRLLLRLYPATILLFISGFAFGAWIMQFVATIYSQTTLELAIQNYWDVGLFLSQIMNTGLLVGIIFELPIILLALLQLGIVKYQTVVSYRRYIYAAIAIGAMLAPPTDILSDIILTVPPLLLFEGTLLLSKVLIKPVKR